MPPALNCARLDLSTTTIHRMAYVPDEEREHLEERSIGGVLAGAVASGHLRVLRELNLSRSRIGGQDKMTALPYLCR